MTAKNIEEYLKTVTDFEAVLRTVDVSSFGLERIQKFLQKINNPQKDLFFIHVAGSKGKGSTCAMLASILVNAGFKVGLYTSPHLEHWSERIRVFGKEYPNKNQPFLGSIPLDKAQQIFDEWRVHWEDALFKSLTFFEFMTALALEYFRREKVDCVVWETGLGGRLDATNAVATHIVAITTIALEHTRLLGHSRDVIAKEKAAIIKDRTQKVVLSPQANDVANVLRERCDEFGIKPFIVGDQVKINPKKVLITGQTIDLMSRNFDISNAVLPLLGRHQLDNLSVVIGIVELLCDKGWKIEEAHVRDGLLNVCWPGRFEIFSKNKSYIVDGAHTAEAMQSVVSTLNELWPQQKFLLVFGVSDDKNKKALADCWQSAVCGVVITRSSHPRAAIFSLNEIEELFPNIQVRLMRNVSEAMALASSWKNAPIVIICGSLFVAAEARRWLCDQI